MAAVCSSSGPNALLEFSGDVLNGHFFGVYRQPGRILLIDLGQDVPDQVLLLSEDA
jgi:hypothetical protein